MDKLVVDTWAWIEYFSATQRGEKVRSLIEGNAELYTCAVSLAEMVSKARRENRDAGEVASAVARLSRILPVDEGAAKSAGEVHAKMKRHSHDFGLADAFVIAAAAKIGAKIVTGDPHFKGLRDVVMV